MQKCRRSYFDLAALVRTMRVIPALDLPQARLAVLRAAEERLVESGRPVNLAHEGLSMA
jgi:hypothetical protein